MSATFTSVEKINTLKQGIEEATGKSYNNLTEAVQELKNGHGQGNGTEILSYTLNKDGTYEPINAEKDHFLQETEPLGFIKMVYITDRVLTPDDVLGLSARLRITNGERFTGVLETEITSDMIIEVSGGIGVLSSGGMPYMLSVGESIVGTTINGLIMPSNVGTYLMYYYNGSNYNGVISIKAKTEKPYIDTSLITVFRSFCTYNRFILLDEIDTSNGTDFSNMFSSCTALKTVPLLDTSNGTNFSSMFYGCTSLETVPLLDTSNGTKFSSMFYGCTSLETVPLLDTSSNTDFTYFFGTCSSLKTIPQIDTSKGENFPYMFNNCSALETVPLLDTSNGRSFGYMFYGCSSLKTVSLTTAKRDFATETFRYCTALENLTIGEGWAVSIYVHYSTALTQESLHAMIENLADLTGLTTKYFQIGETNIAKIDEEHINMLNAKNWTYS